MNTVTINATARESLGKKGTKALRVNRNIPCVMYGGSTNRHFHAHVSQFKPLFYTPEFQVAEVNLNGEVHKAYIKDAQFHPVSDQLMHVDFQELVPGKIVLTELPIELQGLATGVKAGGKLMLKMRKLKVKGLPKHLTSKLVVDVSHLELGKSVRVRDIQVEGLEIMSSPGVPIASVEITRALRAAKAAAAKQG